MLSESTMPKNIEDSTIVRAFDANANMNRKWLRHIYGFHQSILQIHPFNLDVGWCFLYHGFDSARALFSISEWKKNYHKDLLICNWWAIVSRLRLTFEMGGCFAFEQQISSWIERDFHLSLSGTIVQATETNWMFLSLFF